MSGVIFAIGATLIGLLVILYFVIARYRESTYPQKALGYGMNGTTPSVIREFRLVNEDEFI